jgi:hypothetical protein
VKFHADCVSAVGSRDGSVSIETRLRAGLRGSIPSSSREFFSSAPRPNRLLGPFSLLSNGYQGFFTRGKAAGREADHAPPCSAEVKTAWSYSSAPQCVFTASCLVKHREYSRVVRFGIRLDASHLHSEGLQVVTSRHVPIYFNSAEVGPNIS